MFGRWPPTSERFDRGDLAIRTVKTSEYEKGKWHGVLSFMLAAYRDMNPNDPRTDDEYLESLMEHFVASGIVTKENGKYMLPDIVD